MTLTQLAAALNALTVQIDAATSRIKPKDTTPPTVPVIKATGGLKLLSVALVTPSTDAGGL